MEDERHNKHNDLSLTAETEARSNNKTAIDLKEIKDKVKKNNYKVIGEINDFLTGVWVFGHNSSTKSFWSIHLSHIAISGFEYENKCWLWLNVFGLKIAGKLLKPILQPPARRSYKYELGPYT